MESVEWSGWMEIDKSRKETDDAISWVYLKAVWNLEKCWMKFNKASFWPVDTPRQSLMYHKNRTGWIVVYWLTVCSSTKPTKRQAKLGPIFVPMATLLLAGNDGPQRRMSSRTGPVLQGGGWWGYRDL